MVLGIRLTACFLVCAGAATAQDSAEVGGERFDLIAEDNRCVLTVGDAAYTTGLPAPCVFLRRGAGAAPTVEDFGENGLVILVAGPPAHPDDYAAVDWLEADQNCSHLGLGIIMRGRLIELDGPRIEPLGFCPEIAPDQKVYYGIAFGN